MVGYLKVFSQEEYSRVLDEHKGRHLSNAQCIKILREHGASYNQAKNGAYIYLHHRDHMIVLRRGTQEEYNQILDKFNGQSKSNMECIRYLESQGFSQGQAKNAVHKYRKKKGLINL